MPAPTLDREIARLAGPALVALLAEPVYLLADTAVVGHLGTAPLAGLAVASSILLTATSLCIFLAYGTTASVSRLLGAGRHADAAEDAVQGVWLGLFVGVAIAIALGLAGRPLISALGAHGEVAAQALLYLRISLVGLPFLLVTLAGTGYLRGLQDTRTPLLVAVGTAALNLVLELVLVYGLDQGIGASAVGTVLAQVVGAALYLRAVGGAARRAGAPLRPRLAQQRRLIRVGADLAIRTASLRGALVLLTAVATRIGSDDVAAHQIAFEVWNLLAMGLDALAIAGQALVGRLLGASDGDGARAASNRLLRLGIYACVGTGAVVAAASPWLPHVFTDDPRVVHLVTFLLLWVAVLQPLAAVAFVLDGVLIGAGDQRFLAWAMAGAALVFALAVAPILPLDAGIGWVWAAFGAFMAARAVVLVVRFRGDRWLVLGAVPVAAA
ncbi:MAG: hypothetical protein JWM89_513 [Acidimicrobiales bacterium]|nr:hypothetical protein [Acidimicrobiales bacterium]